MKLVRMGPPGQERPGMLVDEDTVVDVASHVADYDGEFFSSGGLSRLASLLGGSEAATLERVSVRGIRLGAPIARPPSVLCIGLNYEDHAKEAGLPIPDEPVLFTKTSNTVVGPTDDIQLPRGGDRTDWEVELAVVIGRRCRYLDDEQHALEAVAGYCVSNDVSERLFQFERGGQWSKGKSCATFNPLGPWLVTPDDVGDVGDLALGLDVNGRQMQIGSTARMVFSVGHIIAYLSQFLVLEPGDVINTGTPPGVGMGMSPPRYLEAGDVVEPWVEGLGRQRCRVVGHGQ